MTKLNKGKLLLVDDDLDLLRLLSMRLGAAGYHTVTVESAEEALARLEMNPFQVMITDLRMEGMQGMALFEAVHQRNPTMPVIILTAHGTIPDAVAATKRGIFAYLTKPFDGQELLESIERAIKLSGVEADMSADEHWRRGIVTRSSLMEDLLGQAKLVAESQASVLIYGESGTGKELLARAIHEAGPRHHQPFIAFNCAAIPESLLESELFGYSRGAFTGAVRDQFGLFQAADHGTLFLDEIGDMPLTLQVKLLRAIQERQVRPVGSTQSVPVDVRLVSATHRNLEEEVAAQRFREDLYYRMVVVTLEVPPLEKRREDIPLLTGHFLSELSKTESKEVQGFAPDALELLLSAPWPGNVRQLFNVVEQTYALSTTSLIPASLVQKALREQPSDYPSFEEARLRFEQEYLVRLLKITKGNVSQAARLAQRGRTDFYKLMRRHRLNPGLFKLAK
ncbi:MAG: sigma 54-interacting transcriptional regulator [Gammaproteobacteria bacterium]|jgi:two-component system response regulator GlrR